CLRLPNNSRRVAAYHLRPSRRPTQWTARALITREVQQTCVRNCRTRQKTSNIDTRYAMSRISVYKRIGIPEGLAVPLTLVALILLVAPYVGELDFGIFKIPDLGDQADTVLRWFGPILTLLAIAFFLPLIPKLGEQERACLEDAVHHAEDVLRLITRLETKPS